MHILIINFNLHELSHAEYLGICDEVAPAFSAVPGLISKQWIANEETNTYGGVYLWQDQQAMLDYKESELFKGLGSNPGFANISIADFDLLTDPSTVTRAV